MSEHGVRVLVVDDNSPNLELARFVLETAGFIVDGATSADEALACIAATPPALILMDIQMPGRDGLSLTRVLKADARTRDIVVVAFTAYAMKGDEQKAQAAGCDGQITKPIDVATFGATVAAFLRPRAPAAAPDESDRHSG